jgi:alpha-tubulin suppressor-like RCC1 family protein
VTAGELGAQTCAVDAAGAAYCWRDNYYGQLGDGSIAGSGIPVAVDATGTRSARLSTRSTLGETHTCAVDAIGAAYCWEDNTFGELGNNTLRGSAPARDRRRPIADRAAGSRVIASIRGLRASAATGSPGTAR